MKQLQKLIWKIEPPKKHQFQTTGEEDVLLIVPRGHEEKVLEDVSKIPDTKGRAIGGGCVLHTKNLADVADIRTCVLHPASATHRQLSDEQLVAAGITPGMIRLSVGLENVDDILDDIKQALKKI